ncbi:MAG TPA: phosphoenolpyruvate carboxylase, partial [Thermomicrobiales bacterium]|nr:phosphoenolpyruvate carboxylase [Thermomicrobiales bacterium]
LWSSDEIRAVTPTVLDEVRAYLVYVTATLVHVVPQIYRDLEAAIAAVYPDAEITVPSFLTFGTWVGGDRDGNPNVTPVVTAEALEAMRDAALAFWESRLVELAGRLSLSERVVGPAPLLHPLLAANRDRFPDLGRLLAERNAGEPYRQAASLMRERVRSARGRQPGGYERPTELLADLRLIERSLRENGSAAIANGDLHDVIRQVEVFGFHVVQLDLRDHAKRHARAIHDLFAASGVAPDYLALPEAERHALLAAEIGSRRPLIPLGGEGLSPEAIEVIETFRTTRLLADRHPGAIETSIISGCERPSDVLAVLLLMKETGLCRPGGGDAMLRIVPLFE